MFGRRHIMGAIMGRDVTTRGDVLEAMWRFA